MGRMMFVNLPVEDLQRSVGFFTDLGLKFDPRFTDDKAACLVLGDEGYVMLLTREFFRTFTGKEICDARSHTETILALSAESREDVDRLAVAAHASGGRPAGGPGEEEFMYSRTFEDPDGHLWEVMYLDPRALEHA